MGPLDFSQSYKRSSPHCQWTRIVHNHSSHDTSPRRHLPLYLLPVCLALCLALDKTTNDMVGAMPGEALPCEVSANGYGAKHLHLQLPAPPKQQPAEADCKWYEEEIDDDLKLCYALNR